MRILLVHNRYQQPGGEDVVFESEKRLLEANGHEVVVFERHNDEIDRASPLRKLGLGVQSIWSWETERAVRALLQRRPADVALFVNTFPLISPSAFQACRDAGVPVLLTVHNYRLVCPGALLHRAGATCEECLGRSIPWPAVRHRCYRGSLGASAAAAALLAVHRAMKAWTTGVDAFLTLTEFAKRELVAGGFPAGKVFVRSNHVDRDPGEGTHRGGFFLFCGRLTAEKGVRVLLDAWRRDRGPRLVIAGDGPLANEVFRAAAELPRVTWLGAVSRQRVLELLGEATALLLPSTWYEGMPMIALEALAAGTPVIASDLGGLPEIVRDEVNGLLVPAGDSGALMQAARRVENEPAIAGALGRGARRSYEERYRPGRAHARLLEILERARS